MLVNVVCQNRGAMANDFLYVDIFSVPLYSSPKSRLKVFYDFTRKIIELGLLSPQVEFIKLVDLVKHGFVSPYSASVILRGGLSSVQLRYFRSFLDFYESCGNIPIFKIRKLWQNSSVRDVNTSLFQSEERDCNFSE